MSLRPVWVEVVRAGPVPDEGTPEHAFLALLCGLAGTEEMELLLDATNYGQDFDPLLDSLRRYGWVLDSRTEH